MDSAYLTVAYPTADGLLTGETIELDAAGQTWPALKEQAHQRLANYRSVKLVSAVLTRWSDGQFSSSVHPSGRVPMNHCFQPSDWA